jgi:hypothetical protein
MLVDEAMLVSFDQPDHQWSEEPHDSQQVTEHRHVPGVLGHLGVSPFCRSDVGRR